MNITLPTDLATQLKAAPNRSGLIAESLREKFDRDAKQKLATFLDASYADAAKEDRQMDEDWDIASGDGL